VSHRRRTSAAWTAALAGIVLAGLLGAGVRAHAGDDPPPNVFTEISAERCGSCHAAQASGAGRAEHADPTAPPCRECHGDPHEATPTAATPIATDAPAPPAAGPDATEMVFVPAGPAIIGNDGREITEGRGNLDETPRHTVQVASFLIDRYEVTNARYKRYVDMAGAPAPRHWKDGAIPEGKERHPVVYVSWFDAEAFCRWEGKRLPNELEWEKAARGPEGRTFPWGEKFALDKANTPQRWASLHEKGDTMPVGSFEAGKSYYGAYDMAGNVWEWTQDWYLPYPGNQYPNSFYGHKNRVLKGGSWYDCLSYGCGLSAPTYNRSRFTPKIRNNSFGFRCAVSADDEGHPVRETAPPETKPEDGPDGPAT
jgi:formylglycine-generating enzyme required for sulfatase activity